MAISICVSQFVESGIVVFVLGVVCSVLVLAFGFLRAGLVFGSSLGFDGCFCMYPSVKWFKIGYLRLCVFF